MTAPAREPTAQTQGVTHLAFGDRSAILEEIDRLFWAIRCHADTGQSFAATETVEGIELAFKHIRACLLQLAELRKGLAP